MRFELADASAEIHDIEGVGDAGPGMHPDDNAYRLILAQTRKSLEANSRGFTCHRLAIQLRQMFGLL